MECEGAPRSPPMGWGKELSISAAFGCCAKMGKQHIGRGCARKMLLGAGGAAEPRLGATAPNGEFAAVLRAAAAQRPCSPAPVQPRLSSCPPRSSQLFSLMLHPPFDRVLLLFLLSETLHKTQLVPDVLSQLHGCSLEGWQAAPWFLSSTPHSPKSLLLPQSSSFVPTLTTGGDFPRFALPL